MGIKLLTRAGMITLAVIVAMGSLGVAYACFNGGWGWGWGGGGGGHVNADGVFFNWAVSNDDRSASRIDPGDNGLDPEAIQTIGIPCDRKTANVAVTTESLNRDRDTLSVRVNNAYPGYLSTIFFGIKNKRHATAIIDLVKIEVSPVPAEPQNRLIVVLKEANGDDLQGDLTQYRDETVGFLSLGLPAEADNSTQELVYTVKITMHFEQNLAITTHNLPNGKVGVPYMKNKHTPVRLEFSGGSGINTWSWAALSGSSLPPGLTLNPSSGIISGVPAAPGLFRFEVTVTDSRGVSDSKQLSIKIISVPSIVTTSLPNGKVGVNYYAKLEADNGEGPYRWSANRLPSGLSLNRWTGVISGKPRNAGVTNFTAKVTDSLGGEDSAEFSIRIVR